ncbi:MAG: LamG-like jellyroll fold domain-containing protein [Verrucomicrobiota bacterium]
MIKALTYQCARPRTRWLAVAAGLLASATLHAALPTPLANLRFEEGSGTSTTNLGSLQGTASFVVLNGYPEFTNLVATGIYTPVPNTASVDFGNLGALQGGQQVNLLVNTNFVADGSLGTNLVGGFTLCGWVNARSLSEGWGGNRIAYALASDNGPGFDLVQLGNGSLRIGINSWPDGSGPGPYSSPGKITADPAAGAANWVFIAVTYDPSLPSGNLKYFFGGPTNLAALDTAWNYTGAPGYGGVIANAGPLTLGNSGPGSFFSTGTGAGSQSRVFQGLMDEFRVYNRALTAAEVQEAQLNGAVPPVPATITGQPVSLTTFQGQPATFSVQVAGSAPITYQWQTNGVNVTGATNANFTIASTTTAMSSMSVKVFVGNPYTATFASDTVTLTVLPENGLKVFTSLSASPANDAGNLQGTGVFAVHDGFPVVITNVPSGPYAPTANIGSVNFGTFTDYTTQAGGRKVQFTNFVGNGSTMGPMTAFTICGWINSADLTSGNGGNRIVYSLDSQNRGFDLVQLASGNLQLGVNQWPDSSPAVSSPLVTADPALGAANWVFFAVSYDGSQPTQNVSFYFGTGSQAATLDWTTDYAAGTIDSSGTLAVGNASTAAFFSDSTGTAGDVRSFRGAIDEIHIYNKVLTLAEIQAAQLAPATSAVITPPTLAAKAQGNQIVISWVSTSSFQLQTRPQLGTGAWADVGTAPTVSGNTNTVTLPATDPAAFYRLKSL